MPTATRQQILMKHSYSSTNTIRNNNIKLAPTIKSASIISFEKSIVDQKFWYLIKVEPLQQTSQGPLNDSMYYIKRRYEDFCQLSQIIHERFGTTNKQRIGSRPLPKIKTKLSILPAGKHLYAQRVEELNQFLTILFQKQSIITESNIVHEFFGIHRSDLVSNNDSHHFILQKQEEEEEDKDEGKADQDNMRELNEDQQHGSNNVSRWKRLRCSSFLARSPPSSNTTTHGLSSFCSQAANKIIPSWHRNHRPSTMTIPCSPQSSISTPASNLTTASRSIRQRKGGEGGLKKCKSSLCIVSENNPELSLSSHISIADTTTTTTSSISHELKSTIKIKVIYDAHNIIVIQVPRTIALHDLRSRIAQKFSDPSIGSPIKVHHEDLVLLFNENGSYSSSSTSSSTHNSDIVTLPAILINKEKDLINMMQTKWNRMNKVTLRCII